MSKKEIDGKSSKSVDHWLFGTSYGSVSSISAIFCWYLFFEHWSKEDKCDFFRDIASTLHNTSTCPPIWPPARLPWCAWRQWKTSNDVVSKTGNFTKNIWAHRFCLQLFCVFLSNDFFFEATPIQPKFRSLISFDKYSQVLKSVVVYLCSFSDLSCMHQNVNNGVSWNSLIS